MRPRFASSRWSRWALALGALFLSAFPGPPAEARDAPARATLLSAAKELMASARYCALVTLDGSGAPQVRVMDPFPPEDDMVVWLGTHRRSRKVGQIRADPRVALHYFAPGREGYVTILGRARLVDDPAEKARRWKQEWEEFYPDREETYLLIEVIPETLEIVSVADGIEGDPETWTPPSVQLAGKPGAPGAGAGAQPSPYAGLERRPIKALSADQIRAYEDGEGMGLAMAAELNRHPGPKHVLELAEELGLTAGQLAETRTIFEEMKASAVDLGRRIVELEGELDARFAAAEITGDELAARVGRIAELQGRLRVAHLAAHLRMVGILSERQIARYVELRGYAGAAGDPPDHGHHRPHGG